MYFSAIRARPRECSLDCTPAGNPLRPTDESNLRGGAEFERLPVRRWRTPASGSSAKPISARTKQPALRAHVGYDAAQSSQDHAIGGRAVTLLPKLSP